MLRLRSAFRSHAKPGDGKRACRDESFWIEVKALAFTLGVLQGGGAIPVDLTRLGFPKNNIKAIVYKLFEALTKDLVREFMVYLPKSRFFMISHHMGASLRLRGTLEMKESSKKMH